MSAPRVTFRDMNDTACPWCHLPVDSHPPGLYDLHLTHLAREVAFQIAEVPA